MPVYWFEAAANLFADIWERKPSPGGATYAPFAQNIKCYYFPREGKPNDVDEYGQVPMTVFVFVFEETQPVPAQSCIVEGGRGYISIAEPVVFADVGEGQGGHKQVVTFFRDQLPSGVTV